MAGILGTKIGMTQIFNENGVLVPVTLVQCREAEVVQRKTQEKDGYDAIVVGVKAKRPSKAKKYAKLVEFKVAADAEFKVGDKVALDQLNEVETVSIVGTSKGKGFQGVVKRHNFNTGPRTHGSKHQRQPGSIGNCKPVRVHKGKKLAGHMGAERVTLHKRKVVALDKKTNCVAIKGALPGATNSLVIIRK